MRMICLPLWAARQPGPFPETKADSSGKLGSSDVTSTLATSSRSSHSCSVRGSECTVAGLIMVLRTVYYFPLKPSRAGSAAIEGAVADSLRHRTATPHQRRSAETRDRLPAPGAAFGGLKPSTRRLLQRIAEDARPRSSSATPTRKLSAGAVLIREWQGTSHQVTVLEDGVLFRGKRHRSLSEVARKITGNRWSGPLFFGLKAPVGENHDGTR
jgi:Protein of unknown function (DUF2924)